MKVMLVDKGKQPEELMRVMIAPSIEELCEPLEKDIHNFVVLLDPFSSSGSYHLKLLLFICIVASLRGPQSNQGPSKTG